MLCRCTKQSVWEQAARSDCLCDRIDMRGTGVPLQRLLQVLPVQQQTVDSRLLLSERQGLLVTPALVMEQDAHWWCCLASVCTAKPATLRCSTRRAAMMPSTVLLLAAQHFN